MPRKKKPAGPPPRDALIHPRHIKMLIDAAHLICMENDGPFEMNPDDDQTGVVCMLTAYSLGVMLGSHYAFKPAGSPVVTTIYNGVMKQVKEGMEHGRINTLRNATTTMQDILKGDK